MPSNAVNRRSADNFLLSGQAAALHRANRAWSASIQVLSAATKSASLRPLIAKLIVTLKTGLAPSEDPFNAARAVIIGLCTNWHF
jgi:hypothetical protein